MEKKESETVITHVLGFYLAITKLEEIKRQGFIDWNVKSPRIQSIPDHVFATTQLAYAIWSEFDIDVDINKVILMLTFHETEEPVIGDIQLESELRAYKKEIGQIAVNSLTENLSRKDYIRSLIQEFNDQQTKEAKFAKFVDKLECDLRSKLYDEEYPVDVHDQEGNPNAKNKLVQELINLGYNFSEMWMEFGRRTYNYPEELNNISKYAQNNNLHEIRNSKLNDCKQIVKDYLDNVDKE